MSNKTCPRCQSELSRVPKSGFSKLLGKFLEVHRHKCQNPECDFQKLIFPEQKHSFKFLVPYAIVLGLPLLIIVTFSVLLSPKTPIQDLPTSSSPANSGN